MKRISSGLSIVSIATFGSLAYAGSGTATYYLDVDNTMVQTTGSGSNLSNGQGDLYVGRTNQTDDISRRRPLLHFPIPVGGGDGQLPANATIGTVTLHVYNCMTVDSSTRIGTLHEADMEWGQGSSYFSGGVGAPSEGADASWWFADIGASSLWANAGGDYSATVSGTGTMSDTDNVWDTFAGAQMTTDVQNWYDGDDNYGWVMLGDETDAQTARRYASMTWLTMDFDNDYCTGGGVPYLTVDWTD
ncbi:MAG TPA: hypothetical protein VGL61_03920 [Kofleriaceae bacterium]|jgi:hypothetical protein